MTMISILYVSKSQIAANDTDAVIGDILADARERNAALGVTGALVFTGTRFAQLLEGDRAAVHGLLDKILLDPRHTDTYVFDEWPIERRVFRSWSMAYTGRSHYIGRAVSKPLAEALRGSRPDLTHLVRLMVQFAVH